MEKFSAYRDPGTGIQPFLTPVPSHETPGLFKVWLIVGSIVSLARTLYILVLAAIYLLVVGGLALLLSPIPPLHRLLRRGFAFFIIRLGLLSLGFFHISVEVVSRKKSRNSPTTKESWHPKAGDIIVSNWTSWVEVLWVAYRFDPIFILPVAPTPEVASISDMSNTPGRRTGTGSAAISTLRKSANAVERTPVVGFHAVSLLKLLRSLGETPATYGLPLEGAQTLDTIRAKARRPLMLFPECTTSNGRGLLRFGEKLFDKAATLPIRGYNIFIMAARYDPPTHASPTMTHSIPSSIVGQVFSLASSFTLTRTLTIRLLAPTESVSSGSFLSSDVIAGGGTTDSVTEACSVLISQLGKLKRTGQGWEEKASFLEFYGRRK